MQIHGVFKLVSTLYQIIFPYRFVLNSCTYIFAELSIYTISISFARLRTVINTLLAMRFSWMSGFIIMKFSKYMQEFIIYIQRRVSYSVVKFLNA